MQSLASDGGSSVEVIAAERHLHDDNSNDAGYPDPISLSATIGRKLCELSPVDRPVVGWAPR